MKKVLLSLMALSLIAVSCKDDKQPSASDAATAAKAPEKKLTKEEEEKVWMEYATPGAMHQWMAKTSGTWDGDMTMWMNPDSPAMKMKGVAQYKTLLDGRYLEGVHTSKMNMGGMEFPFEGKSTMAYDNHTKKFISTWIDNMGTGVMVLEGTYDEKTKTLTSTGKMVDPTAGGQVDVKEVVTFIDDNTQKMEMYCTKNGKEMKTMEMMATKRK